METTSQLIERHRAEQKAHEARLLKRIADGERKLHDDQAADYIPRDLVNNDRRRNAEKLLVQLNEELHTVRCWIQVTQVAQRDNIFGAGVLHYKEVVTR
jgi:hypothetical protein